MLYDLSALLPLVVVVTLLALVGAAVSLATITQTLVEHHRIRVARHQSIPTYYRRLVLAH